jgi:hypothetical protein
MLQGYASSSDDEAAAGEAAQPQQQAPSQHWQQQPDSGADGVTAAAATLEARYPESSALLQPPVDPSLAAQHAGSVAALNRMLQATSRGHSFLRALRARRDFRNPALLDETAREMGLEPYDTTLEGVATRLPSDKESYEWLAHQQRQAPMPRHAHGIKDSPRNSSRS